jgi:hypothetical protein
MRVVGRQASSASATQVVWARASLALRHVPWWGAPVIVCGTCSFVAQLMGLAWLATGFVDLSWAVAVRTAQRLQLLVV